MIKKWQRREGEGGYGRVEGRCRRQYRISRWNDTTINCRAHTCRHHSFANGIKKREERKNRPKCGLYREHRDGESGKRGERERGKKKKELASFIARIKGSVRVIGLSRVIRTMYAYIFSENQARTLLRSLHTHIRARAHTHAHILAANPLNEHYVELYQ